MKGITEIEFIISVFVFITTISFVTIIIINNIPFFHNTALGNNLKTKSWQYSEMLLFDEGYPNDWNAKQFSEIRRIGLSSSRYFVDINKLSKLSVFCSDPNVGYKSVKNLLGIDFTNDIVIEASYLDDSPIVGSKMICGPSVITQLRPQFQTIRLGILNSSDMPIIRIRTVVIG